VPGVTGGMEWSISLSQPMVDFTPQDASSTLPAPLTVGANQFSIAVQARICVACGLRPSRRPNDRPPDQRDRRQIELTCATVDVWAVGEPTVAPAGVETVVGLHVDHIVVKDVGALEAIIECVALETVNAMLDRLKQTVSTIVLHGFGLTLVAGPTIADDQLEVWGDVIPPTVAQAGGMDVDP